MQTLLAEETWVRAARLYACEVIPWFAQALYAAPFIVVRDLPAPAAIDRQGRVYFSAPFLQRLQQAVESGALSHAEAMGQIAFLWYHEIAHWLREHGERAEAIGADPFLWNIAADLEINDDPPRGFSFPSLNGQSTVLYPKLFELPDGQIAEWYYEQLQQPAAGVQKHIGKLMKDLQGGAAGTGGSQGKRDDASTDGVQAQEGSSRLDEGSGVHGQARPWEERGEDSSSAGLSEVDRQSLREAVAAAIEGHSNARGEVPGGWRRWAEAIHKPRLNWQELLRRTLGARIAEGFGHRLDYSFRRPHRRSSLYKPLYLPALQGLYQPRIACVIDTSGSIGEAQLRQTLTEVWTILKSFQIPVTVIPCDSRAYRAIQLTNPVRWPVLREHLQGGGGTDMRAGLKAALELRPEPTLILVFTDGYTPYPEAPPKKAEVLWIIWKSPSARPSLPPMPPWRKEKCDRSRCESVKILRWGILLEGLIDAV